MRSGKLVIFAVGVAFVCAASAPYALADTEDAVRGVLTTMSGPNMLDNPRSSTTPEGYLRHVAAPSGNAFQPSPSAKKAGAPDAIAKSFLKEHDAAFGIHAGVTFTTNRVKSENARTFVKLDQVYKGVPVFGAQAIVQMKPDGGIVSILSDIMRDAPRVYSGELSLTPLLDGDEAAILAAGVLEDENPGIDFETNDPALYLYAPPVIGATGAVRLVYIVEASNAGAAVVIAERILIDAHSGATALRIPMILEAKNRTIYDAENVPDAIGTLRRAEGQPATNIHDVDAAYDFYGDTYDFYLSEHGRDSIDGAGMTMDATVRFCYGFCPFRNAFWDGVRMFFGEGWVTDDVVGHELTHGVTQHESNLIYSYESGALNESFSDVWGEFIDLANAAGTDTPEVKWLVGEDIANRGAIRSMKNPPAMSDPDTYLGPFWVFDSSDNGGVHTNSGVSNKLCYLLTDGDTFNGYIIDPMGIPTVAELYYECQTNLLGEGSDYPDFGNQLIVAAENLGLNDDEIDNVERALYATRILEFKFDPLRHFRAAGRSGDSRVALTWKNPTGGDFTGVDVVRNSGTSA